MNLANLSNLTWQSLSGLWFRALEPRYLRTALQTSQTRLVPTRFHPGPAAGTQFEVLYLAENQMVALFEVRALYGVIYTPGAVVANPVAPTRIPINVQVNLQSVVDLTATVNLNVLDTTTQELSGDWEHYGPRFAAALPNLVPGTAPTQEVGQALSQVAGAEGFTTLSAPGKPYRNLVVFPQNLQPGSWIRTIDPTSGQVMSIP